MRRCKNEMRVLVLVYVLVAALTLLSKLQIGWGRCEIGLEAVVDGIRYKVHKAEPRRVLFVLRPKEVLVLNDAISKKKESSVFNVMHFIGCQWLFPFDRSEQTKKWLTSNNKSIWTINYVGQIKVWFNWEIIKCLKFFNLQKNSGEFARSTTRVFDSQGKFGNQGRIAKQFITFSSFNANNPRTLRIDHSLGIQIGSISTSLGSYNVFGNLHRLALNSLKCPVRGSNAKPSDQDQDSTEYPTQMVHPVLSYRHGGKFGDRYGFLCIMLLWVTSCVPTWKGADLLEAGGRRLKGWSLIALAVLLLALGASIGAVGCMPWDWWRCLHDGQEHSQREVIHSGGRNISQACITHSKGVFDSIGREGRDI